MKIGHVCLNVCHRDVPSVRVTLLFSRSFGLNDGVHGDKKFQPAWSSWLGILKEMRMGSHDEL